MTKITLNGVEVTLTQEQIDQILKENEKKGGYPENGTGYWRLTAYGLVLPDCWDGAEEDTLGFDTGNYYTTEAEAEKALEKLQALARIRKYIRENNYGIEPNWENLNMPFFPRCFRIGYHRLYGDFFVNVVSTARFETNIGYLKSSLYAEDVIKNCKDDLLTYFGVEK
jgi:hypothetical protein